MRPPTARWTLRILTLLALLALAFTVPGVLGQDEAFTMRGLPTALLTPVSEWPSAEGPGGTHASPLAEISRATVARLEPAWTYHTGDVGAGDDGRAGTAFEATPVVVDGTLYVPTPYGRLIALDAETGAELWIYDPGMDRSDAEHGMVTSRGVGVHVDDDAAPATPCRVTVFLATYDAWLHAVDGRTGLRCPRFARGEALDLGEGVPGIEGHRSEYRQTAPPAVVHDLVVLGSTIYDSRAVEAPSGVVRAFDVRSGELRWSWEPLPAEAGVRSGAANVWASMTPDPARDLLFVATGSASPDHWGGSRPGDNGYANAVVALRASTGEVVWHFQTVHHDLWDYDLPAPPALIDIRRGDVIVPAVVQATKMGFLFVLHRETGAPLYPVVERPVPASDVPGEWTSPTQPVPLVPRPLVPSGLSADDAWGLTPIDRALCRRAIEALRNEGMYTPPSLRGSLVDPGFLGGMEWGGVAWDPATGILVTNTNRLAMVARLLPRDSLEAAHDDRTSYVAGQTPAPYGVRRGVLASPLGIPCTPPPWGMLHGVDMNTGNVLWERPLGTIRDLSRVPAPAAWGSPNLGGALVAGGLAFIGASMDRRLRAFDLATGEQVWEAELPASAQATPMTYRVRPGGRQYIVVAAGGHQAMGSSLGDAVVAFALPDEVRGPRIAGGASPHTPPTTPRRAER